MKESLKTIPCADLQTAATGTVATLATASKGSARLTGDLVQTIGTVFETLECFNEVSSQRGEVDVTVGAVGQLTYTGAVARDAEVHFGINATFAVNEELQLSAYVNGVPYSDDDMHIRGLGINKPVTGFWISHFEIHPGDVIELMAKNAVAADMDITFHRSVFALKIDV